MSQCESRKQGLPGLLGLLPKLHLVALVLLLAFALVACTTPAAPSNNAESGAGDGASVETAAPAAAGDTVEIQFWDMVWGPPQYVDAGKALVDQFNQQETGVTAAYQSTPWNNWYQTFLTLVSGKSAAKQVRK